MASSGQYALCAVRFALSLIFINSLIGKITGFATTAQFMASNGFFFPSIFLVLAILIESAGILSLVTGRFLTHGARLLLIFVFCVTFIFHTKIVDPLQLAMFLKNVALMGGLGILSIAGSGKKPDEAYSVSEKRYYFLARIAVALIFVVMGLIKMFEYDAAKQMMIEAEITSTDLFLVMAIVIELAGGISICAGYQVAYASLALIVYLIPVTLIMHLELTDVVQRIMFFKNIALMGALGLIALYGARPWKRVE